MAGSVPLTTILMTAANQNGGGSCGEDARASWLARVTILRRSVQMRAPYDKSRRHLAREGYPSPATDWKGMR